MVMVTARSDRRARRSGVGAFGWLRRFGGWFGRGFIDGYLIGKIDGGSQFWRREVVKRRQIDDRRRDQDRRSLAPVMTRGKRDDHQKRYGQDDNDGRDIAHDGVGGGHLRTYLRLTATSSRPCLLATSRMRSLSIAVADHIAGRFISRALSTNARQRWP